MGRNIVVDSPLGRVELFRGSTALRRERRTVIRPLTRSGKAPDGLETRHFRFLARPVEAVLSFCSKGTPSLGSTKPSHFIWASARMESRSSPQYRAGGEAFSKRREHGCSGW